MSGSKCGNLASLAKEKYLLFSNTNPAISVSASPTVPDSDGMLLSFLVCHSIQPESTEPFLRGSVIGSGADRKIDPTPRLLTL